MTTIEYSGRLLYYFVLQEYIVKQSRVVIWRGSTFPGSNILLSTANVIAAFWRWPTRRYVLPVTGLKYDFFLLGRFPTRRIFLSFLLHYNKSAVYRTSGVFPPTRVLRDNTIPGPELQYYHNDVHLMSISKIYSFFFSYALYCYVWNTLFPNIFRPYHIY